MKNSPFGVNAWRALIVAGAMMVLTGALSPVEADVQASPPALGSLTPLVSRFVAVVDQQGQELRGRLVRVSDDEVVLDINRSTRAITIAGMAVGVATYAAIGALIGRAFHHYTVVFRNDASPASPDHVVIERRSDEARSRR